MRKHWTTNLPSPAEDMESYQRAFEALSAKEARLLAELEAVRDGLLAAGKTLHMMAYNRYSQTEAEEAFEKSITLHIGYTNGRETPLF